MSGYIDHFPRNFVQNRRKFEFDTKTEKKNLQLRNGVLGVFTHVLGHMHFKYREKSGLPKNYGPGTKIGILNNVISVS